MTMDDVAGAVGIAKASLYKHFSSKDALCCAAVVQMLAQVRSYLEALAPDAPPLEKLRAVVGWSLLGDAAGSIVVEISKGTYANWPTVSVITASAKPTLATSRKGTSTALTGWTTAIAADDVLRIGVNSVTGMQRVVLVVKVRRG